MWMLILTLALVVAIPLSVELGMCATRWRAWPALRWALLPPLGVLMGALVPARALPMVPFADDVLSMAMGAVMATFVAIYGLFRVLLLTGPTTADVARTGKRSVYRGPIRI